MIDRYGAMRFRWERVFWRRVAVVIARSVLFANNKHGLIY